MSGEKCGGIRVEDEGGISRGRDSKGPTLYECNYERTNEIDDVNICITRTKVQQFLF